MTAEITGAMWGVNSDGQRCGSRISTDTKEGIVRRFSIVSIVVAVMVVIALVSSLAANAGAASSITAKASVVPTSTAKMSCGQALCFSATAGNDAVVKVVTPQRFTAIDHVSITLRFPRGDALDTCDEIDVAVVGAGGATGQVVACDAATTLTAVTITLPSLGPPFTDMIAQFLDGRAQLSVWMFNGSATLSSATVTVTGTL